jgi:hypothetical protein
VNVKLHIERLVIDGAALAPGAKGRLLAAVEAELTRLIARDGIAREYRAGGATPALTAGTIGAQSKNPAQFGIEIARAVHGGLKNPRPR